jgi:cell division septal protein FtsQ
MTDKRKTNSSKIINLPIDFKGVNGQQLSKDEIRSRKKKKLRRRRAIKRALLSSGLLLIIAIIGFVLAFTIFFKVNTINVKGSKVYSPKIILQNCGVVEGDSLLLVNANQIAENLMSTLPYIGSVSITRDLPSTLTINITDTYTAAAIMNNGTYILINEKGKVLDDSADIINDGIPVVTGVEVVNFKKGEIITFKNKENGDILIELLKAVTKAGVDRLTEIDVTDTSEIFMKYDNRIKILVGSSVNLETKILRAASAIERENEINQYEIGVLDLRTEPRVYFKAGSDETTTQAATDVTETGENNDSSDETTDLNKTSENSTEE